MACGGSGSDFPFFPPFQLYLILNHIFRKITGNFHRCPREAFPATAAASVGGIKRNLGQSFFARKGREETVGGYIVHVTVINCPGG